jgi:surface glycoprotein (TIGR04207 family)
MSGSREKLRAVFLAFVMVLSVFGGTVALTGSTAATADTVQITSSTPASSGQAITFDAGVSNLNTDLQVYVDADENGDLGFGETKIEVPANAEEISVSDPGSSVTADAKSVAQVGSVNALIAEDTSGGDSTVTIAADSADSLTGGDNINTVTDIQNSETTRLGSTPSPSASVSGAPTQVSTFTFNVDINDDANLNEGEILLFGGSTLSGASTVGIAGEGTSGESGTTTFTIIANSAPSGGDAVHRVDTNIDDTSDTNFDVNGDQTVFGSSNTVTDTITPTNADDSAIISVQQTSSLTPSGTNTPDASTNSFTIIEALAGTGDSSSQVNYEIGSGNSEQTLIFGNANNSVNLLQFQDATDDSAFSGSVTLKLPQGVTVNNSASDLNPNTVIGTGSLSGEINSVSVSNNNREVTIDLAASSDTGDKIRFTGGSLVVDVDPTQFNTRGGSDNFDLGAVQFDHSLGQVSIDNPDLFNANQLNPGTTITGSLSVNQNGQALSQSSSIDLDNVDAGAIGNGTAIEVRLNNGVTFDESIAGDDIVPAGTDIDGDNTDELNTSAVTVNGDTLTIPISDPVDSNDNTIDFDVGFDQGLSVDGGQLDASGNDLTPGDVIADIGDDSEPAIVDQTVADGNSPTTIDVARDQPADFDDNDDIDLITGFSGQSDTDQDIAGSSATEFGADESSITLTADGDLPEISSGNLIAISSDTTASTSDTFVIALEAGTSDSEIAVTGASQTSFSAGDNILVVDPAANVGSSTDTDLEINGGSQNIDSSDPIRFNTTGGAQDPNVNISIEATAVSNGPFQISDSSGSATLSSALTVNSPQVDLNPSNGDVNVLAGADARLVQDSSKNVEIDLTSASVPANTFINVTTNNSAVTFDALDVGEEVP